MIENKVLVGIIAVIIGGIIIGAIAYAYQDQQDDGLNFNSTDGFGNSSGNSYFLNVNVNYNVLSVVVINSLNYYIEIINININEIGFNGVAEEYVDVGGHSFNIPMNSIVSNGYSSSENSLYFSEFYQTNDNTIFGIIVVSNPSYSAEQMVNDFSIDNNLNIGKINLIKIGSLENINVYKFESNGIVYYVYDDGADIVIILMNNQNDNLFMYLTNTSSTGDIDPSNPYYVEIENLDEDSMNLEDNQENTTYDDEYYDTSYDEEPYYDEGYYY